MAELTRLRQLNEWNSEYNFMGTGVTANGAEFEESDLFESVFQSISQLHTSERTVTIPGLADAKSLIRGAVTHFAREVIETNFRAPPEAEVDDVTMQLIRPETFEKTNFQQDGLSADTTVTIVDTTSLDDDEQVIVTDVIEYDSNAPITAIQHTIDGNEKEAETIRPQVKNSDLQIYPLISPAYAKEEYKLEAKVEESGSSELTPTGVHIAKGDLVGDLN